MTEETLPPEIDEWFVVHEVDESTHAICEPYHEEVVHSFLLDDPDRPVLIDTGLGIGDLKGKVEELTDVDTDDVVVVTSHVDWDHLGAHDDFGDVWVHEGQTVDGEVIGGEQWLVDGIPGRMTDELEKRFDEERFRCSGEPDWDYEYDDVYTGEPDRTFDDGKPLELGDRTLEVLHTPGHAPGHCCFYEAETGYLFTGDLVYPGPIYVHEDMEGTDRRDFRRSIARLADFCRRETVSWLLPSHQGTAQVNPRVVEAMERTLAEHPDRATGSLDVEWEPYGEDVVAIEDPCESDALEDSWDVVVEFQKPEDDEDETEPEDDEDESDA